MHAFVDSYCIEKPKKFEKLKSKKNHVVALGLSLDHSLA